MTAMDSVWQGWSVEFFSATPNKDGATDGAVIVQQAVIRQLARRFLVRSPRLSAEELTSGNGGVDPIVDLFSCSICQRILDTPITLPCEKLAHTFCRSCLVGGKAKCPKCDSDFSPVYVAIGKPSLTVQTLTELFFPDAAKISQLKKDGNRCFQAGQYSEAEEKYTEALKIAGNDAMLLSNRSSAFLRRGEVQKALDDAESAIALKPTWPKSFYRKLLALREMRNITEALVAGFQMMLLDRDIVALLEVLPDLIWWFLLPIDEDSFETPAEVPSFAAQSNDVEKSLRMIDELLLRARTDLLRVIAVQRENGPSSRPSPRPVEDSSLEEHLTCSLCYRLFYQAVTPNCGHSFCRECLQRVLDFKPSCPQCRQDLSDFLATRQFSPSEILETLSSMRLPMQYAEREAAHTVEMASLLESQAATKEIAVFVLTTAWPTMPFVLHVFEPRYRLMMRRAVESGSKLFGMCAYAGEESTLFVNVGTMMKIEDIQYFDDGRCMVACVGTRRFRVLSKGLRDGRTCCHVVLADIRRVLAFDKGYSVAQFEYIEDDRIPADELQAAQELQDGVYEKVQNWLNNLGPARYASICEIHGALPPKADLTEYDCDGPQWIWWILAILSTVRNTYAHLLEDCRVVSRMRSVSVAISDLPARFFRSAS